VKSIWFAFDLNFTVCLYRQMTTPEEDQTPPDNIERMDWRINKLSWTTAPFTDPRTSTVIPAGAAVTPAVLIKYGKHRVGISIPNATALFLGLSQQYHVEAAYLIERCIGGKDQYGHLPDDKAFTFYERIMASTVFACTALEAFVNEEIPDTYVHVVNEKNFTRHYNKEQIERNLNLDTKLGDALPGALGVNSPKGGSLWNAYDKLLGLRDRVIHMKTKDRDFQGEDKGSIWNALLSDPLPEPHAIAKRMIKYFLDATGKKPRWFDKCPF
jgi:hypothetical protein